MSQSIAEGGVQYGFVGAGVMAEVMVSGLLQEGGLRPDQLIVSDRSSARQAALGALGVRVTPDNLSCALASPVVVLAVKPQTLAEVLAELRGRLPADTLVVSIVAGARIRAIQEGLGHQRVVRCMPNLPCRIRQGMTVWTAASGASGLDAARTRALLRPMGIEHYVDDEGHLDRATAVSGSGPAIVAEFIKAMFEAAVFIGEPRGLAHESVLATVIGTAQMIREEGQRHTHVAQLIDEVTSPGGTTSRALQVLKRGQLAATINDAVEAAHARTVALGDALEQSLLTAAAQAPGLPAPTVSAPVAPAVTVAPEVPVVPVAPEVAVQPVVPVAPVAPVVLVAPAPVVAAPKAPAVPKVAKAKAEPKDPVAPAEAAAPEAPAKRRRRRRGQGPVGSTLSQRLIAGCADAELARDLRRRVNTIFDGQRTLEDAVEALLAPTAGRRFSRVEFKLLLKETLGIKRVNDGQVDGFVAVLGATAGAEGDPLDFPDHLDPLGAEAADPEPAEADEFEPSADSAAEGEAPSLPSADEDADDYIG